MINYISTFISLFFSLSLDVPPDVQETALRREQYSIYCQSDPPEDLDEMILWSAHEFNIPSRMVAVTILTESECNPLAVGSRGELGLMQIRPEIWMKAFPARLNITDLTDPFQNVRAGSWILSELYHKYGDDYTAHLRYNGRGKRAASYAAHQVVKAHIFWGKK